MGKHVRETDWAATPLGAYETWPQSLRSFLSLVLNTKNIAALCWGPRQCLLYNDACGIALGDYHPEAFGCSMPEALKGMGPVLGAQVAEVLRTGEGFAIQSLSLKIPRNGRDEETVWACSFSPVQGEDGKCAGVLLLATEIAKPVIAERSGDIAHDGDQKLARERIWQLSSDMMGVADEHGVWLSINPAWTRTLGWKPDEIVGRTSEWLEHPDDVAKTKAELQRLATGRTTLEFDNRLRTRDGDYRTLSWTAVPENGRLYCVTRDVTDLRAREEAEAERAAAQERNWRFNPDLLSVIDMRKASFERVNPAWKLALGWSIEEMETRPYADFVHPDDIGASAAAFENVRDGNPVLRFENRYRTKGGDWRRLSWVAIPEGDKLYSSARDVTVETEQAEALLGANELIAEKERAERQQRILQSEMAHRIKNTLSMVIAIVSQTMRHATSMKEASNTIEQRIAALSNAQDLLRQTTYTSAGIRNVLLGALEPHLGRGDRVTMTGNHIDLPSQAALGLSLAVHELATNAVKYGALSDDRGRVSIEWRCGADGAFRFEWKELEGPAVAPPSRTGFGSRLINQIVPSYFNGSGATEFASHGLVYVLDGTIKNEMVRNLEPADRRAVSGHGHRHDR